MRRTREGFGVSEEKRRLCAEVAGSVTKLVENGRFTYSKNHFPDVLSCVSEVAAPVGTIVSRSESWEPDVLSSTTVVCAGRKLSTEAKEATDD